MVTWLNETTLGRTIKVLVYVAVSGAISALVAYLANQPNLFNPYIMAFINLLLVAAKNLVDPNVKNL